MKIGSFFYINKAHLAILLGGSLFSGSAKVASADVVYNSPYRYGVNIKQMIAGNYGGFFEYRFYESIGVRTGLEYAYNLFVVEKDQETKEWSHPKVGDDINKAIDSNNMFIGGYIIKYVNIPLVARIYPTQGELALNFGIEISIMPSASFYSSKEDKKKISFVKESTSKSGSITKKEVQSILGEFKGIEKKLTKDDKIGDKSVLNSIQLAAIVGLDYTTSFGLIFGTEYTYVLSSFVNTSDNIYSFGEFKLQFKLGFDISKVI